MSTVLDAFLHKTLFDDLRRKGIYLLPTPKIFSETLKFDFILELMTGEGAIPAVSDICIEGHQIHPVFPKKPLRLTHGLRYIVHPLRLDDDGYGLVCIDFANQISSSSGEVSHAAAGAYYFVTHEDSQRDRSKLHELYWYLKQISLPDDKIEIKHLARPTSSNSAEYVIALLQALAAPSFYLGSLRDLDGFELAQCEDTIAEYIRLSQIRLFGPKFYWFQREKRSPVLKRDEIYRHLIDVFPQMDPGNLQDLSFDLEEKFGSSSSSQSTSPNFRAKRRYLAAASFSSPPVERDVNSMNPVLKALQKLHFQRQTRAISSEAETLQALAPQ